MKKLMIAASLVCAVALSQAATVEWSSDALKTPDTDQNITAGRVQSYIWALDGAIEGDVWTALTQTTGTGASTVWSFKTAASGDNDSATYGSGVLSITDNKSWTAPGTAYDAIVIWRDVNANDKMDIGDYVNVAQGAYTMELDSEYFPSMDGLTQSNWVQLQAVPEPTSGMLLLLGMAGLALRRRRA